MGEYSSALVDGIREIIKQELGKQSFDKTLKGIVTSVDNEKKVCDIKIYDKIYTSTPMMTSVSVGDIVYILFPQSNATNRVVIGKIL